MKNEQYIYHRIAIRKGSLAHKGLEKEVARRVGINNPATLLSESIHDLYEKLAEEGNEDIDLLSLGTRITLQQDCHPAKEKERIVQAPIIKSQPWVAGDGNLESLDDNFGEFLQGNL
jgi:hypothetical protein